MIIQLGSRRANLNLERIADCLFERAKNASLAGDYSAAERIAHSAKSIVSSYQRVVCKSLGIRYDEDGDSVRESTLSFKKREKPNLRLL